jgi:DNA-binding transcriptional regulator YiaG
VKVPLQAQSCLRERLSLCLNTRVTRETVRRVSRMRRMAKSGTARTLRVQSELSLRDLAGVIGDGVNISDLSHWERGLRVPTATTALAWFEALAEITGRDLDAISIEVAA